ncbi:hypothetical protein HAX54_043928 [Datura stramonium]|uniref:Uncharacterized protein n=1 Tax=Datura stramonium TaxID=4076 RepID=A0ABS8W4D0_DATST|nr:hypothetical protein [Datura stramonium]
MMGGIGHLQLLLCYNYCDDATKLIRSGEKVLKEWKLPHQVNDCHVSRRMKRCAEAVVLSSLEPYDGLNCLSGTIPILDGSVQDRRKRRGEKGLARTNSGSFSSIKINRIRKRTTLLYFTTSLRPKVLLEKVSGAIKKDLLLTPRCADQQRDATTSWSGERFRSLFRCYAIVVAREPLNGGSFHLIAGVWKTSASKHSAAKRVQDCFAEWEWTSIFASKAWSTLCRSLPLSRDFTWLPFLYL